MFYSAEFDPVRIVGQIILLQSSFYLSLSLLFYVLYFLFNIPLHIALIFSSKSLLYYFPEQWYTLLIFTITALGIVPFIMQHVVMRAKLCLDFVLTLFGLHWFFVFLYDGMALPYGGMYYYVYYLVIIILCVVASEYLCLRMELSSVPLDFINLISANKDSKAGGDKGKKPARNSRNIDHGTGLGGVGQDQRRDDVQRVDDIEMATTSRLTTMPPSPGFKLQPGSILPHKKRFNKSQFDHSSGSETELDDDGELDEHRPLKHDY